jgi:hypothetical protein
MLAAARPMPLLAPVTITLRPLMSGRFVASKVVMGDNVERIAALSRLR